MSHTSGLWTINKINPWTINYLLYDEPLSDVNVVCRMPNKNPKTEANAILIAAAPELLETLKDISVWLTAPATDKATIDHWKQKVSTVITKATGEK